MYKRVIIAFLLLTLSKNMFASNRDYSSGLDCSLEGLSNIEIMICNDEELLQKDFRMNRIYKMALEKSNNKEQVQTKQKNWINEVRNRCNSAECLKNIYESQEIFLGGIAINDGKFKMKSEWRDSWKTNDGVTLVEGMNNSFSHRKDITGFVISCDDVWENHAGRINHGWGGICWAVIDGNVNEYFICSNAVSYDYEPVAIRNEYLLVRYLEQHCYGG